MPQVLAAVLPSVLSALTPPPPPPPPPAQKHDLSKQFSGGAIDG